MRWRVETRNREGGRAGTPHILSHAIFSLSLSLTHTHTHTRLSLPGYALPKPLALAAVARWGLGPVSCVALAAGAVAGAGWLCKELGELEGLPPSAWRVGKGRGRGLK